jgi:hypothetical protein
MSLDHRKGGSSDNQEDDGDDEEYVLPSVADVRAQQKQDETRESLLILHTLATDSGRVMPPFDEYWADAVAKGVLDESDDDDQRSASAASSGASVGAGAGVTTAGIISTTSAPTTTSFAPTAAIDTGSSFEVLGSLAQDMVESAEELKAYVEQVDDETKAALDGMSIFQVMGLLAEAKRQAALEGAAGNVATADAEEAAPAPSSAAGAAAGASLLASPSLPTVAAPVTEDHGSEEEEEQDPQEDQDDSETSADESDTGGVAPAAASDAGTSAFAAMMGLQPPVTVTATKDAQVAVPVAAPPREMLQLMLRELSDRTSVLHLELTATLGDLRREVFLKTGVPANEQRLIFASKELHDDGKRLMSDCGLIRDSFVHLTLRLLGGARRETSSPAILPIRSLVWNPFSTRSRLGDDHPAVVSRVATPHSALDMSRVTPATLATTSRGTRTIVAPCAPIAGSDTGAARAVGTVLAAAATTGETTGETTGTGEKKLVYKSRPVDVARDGPDVCGPILYHQVEGKPDSYLELTHEQCIISGASDDSDPRVKMPCGHGITPQALTDYMTSVLERTGGGKVSQAHQYWFECQALNCGRRLPYTDLRRLAMLTPAERKAFEPTISNNFMRGALKADNCPRCYTLCCPPSLPVRSDTQEIKIGTQATSATGALFGGIVHTEAELHKRAREREDAQIMASWGTRVACLACKYLHGNMYQFCSNCKQEWKTPGFKCSTKECTEKYSMIQTLATCDRFKLSFGSSSWDDVPSIRACPTCCTLITHIGKCKHMVCPKETCGKKREFCFVCLDVVNDKGQWKCGQWSTRCPVAPPQTLADLKSYDAAKG